MPMPNRKTHRFPVYAIFAVVYVLSALYAMSYFFQNSSLGDAYPRTRFDAMIDGYASKPFIYRQLVPIFVRAIDRITPPDARGDVNNWVENIKTNKDYREFRRYTPWLEATFPLKITHYKRLVASIIIFTFLLLYMAVIFALGRKLFPNYPAVALLAPPFAMMAITSFGYQWQYIYDIPCLCLSTACFYFMYTQRFRLYLMVFFLSCLNKETAIFSMIFFAIWHVDKLGNKKFAVLWALQCAIYLSIKTILTVEYLNNPGYFLEQNMIVVLARDVLAEANLPKILLMAMMWFLFSHHWQDKPEFLKKSLWLLPMMYAAYFLYGYPMEYRVFFDLHGPLVLLATHTLVVATGIAHAPVFSLSNLRWKHS